MPHISKKHPGRDIYLQIYEQLMLSIVEAKTRQKAKDLAHGLFTKTERVMLAKRLAIILMVDKDESAYAIAEKLKVSTSTVLRIRGYYEEGRYAGFLSGLGKEKGSELLALITAFVQGDRRGMHKAIGL